MQSASAATKADGAGPAALELLRKFRFAEALALVARAPAAVVDTCGRGSRAPTRHRSLC